MDKTDSALDVDCFLGSIPGREDERERILAAVRSYVSERELVPPLTFEDVRDHGQSVLQAEDLPRAYRDFTMVLLGNEVWRATMASIPYERRILLLPQCLRSSTECPAQLDEFGLVCEECGRCPIGELQSLAEGLGYVVLVAEGTAVVTQLLERGKVDAVIGVGCLDALEKSFPHTTAHAIPAMAFPLLFDGCKDTETDVHWVRDAITLASPSGWRARLDLDRLRQSVGEWFSPERLATLVSLSTSSPEAIALNWMTKAGKRWRPFLVAAVYEALTDPGAPLPGTVRKLAVAAECFHKASLIHDDIEDGDGARYNEATLHRKHGVPIALNTGDLLLGLGYELLARCGLPDGQSVRLLQAAAEAHRKLCLGQGEELAGTRSDTPLSSAAVLDIFRLKTSPAFGAALQFGAIAAGAGPDVCKVLEDFSDSLGVAYQILDDLEDAKGAAFKPARPSLLYALALELGPDVTGERGAMAVEKAGLLFEHYKNQAIRSLNPLRNAELKGLLRRIAGKILNGA